MESSIRILLRHALPLLPVSMTCSTRASMSTPCITAVSIHALTLYHCALLLLYVARSVRQEY